MRRLFCLAILFAGCSVGCGINVDVSSTSPDLAPVSQYVSPSTETGGGSGGNGFSNCQYANCNDALNRKETYSDPAPVR